MVFSTLLINCAAFAGEPAVAVNQTKQQLFGAAFQRFEVRHKAFESSSRLIESKNGLLLPQSDPGMKSRGRAFFQSLLLPGWGQHYAGSKDMMKVFITTEVLAWGAVLGFSSWSNWLEDDFRTYAVTHAQIDLAGKNERYFVDIGNFNTLEDYNQAQLRDRDVSDLYPTESNEFYWRWDIEENRRRFEDMRIRSGQADSRARFALAAVLVNHLVSAIHSTLAVFQHNKRVSQDLGYLLEYDDSNNNLSMRLRIQKSF